MASPELLEREGELEQLHRLVDDAVAGRGRLAFVEGPPGIGKTRLLEAARATARERGMVALSARATELEREVPFGVVRQLFEPPVAGADADRRSKLLEGAAQPAGPLLIGGRQERHLPQADEDPALPLFHALYWLLANLADEGPVALAIDDAHWADATSLSFLLFLLARMDELPVLVALASRPAEASTDRRLLDALATDALTFMLRPAPLSEGAVTAMVAAELGESAEPAFCGACRDATGGNPFLLRELLGQLAAEGVAPAAEQAPLVRQVAPPTVARAVLLRLARLGEEAVSLARAVAVLGDGAPLRRAGALAGLDEDRADELAASLAQAHVLGAARPLAFAHPILRSAVYGEIEPGERAGAHRRAAALLEDEGAGPDAIAVHLLATQPAGDPEVVATLREAAAHALARGAAATAVACLRRVLTEPPNGGERAALLLELASAELRAGHATAAAEHFDEGMRGTSDPRVRAACVAEHSVALQAVGRNDEARSLVEGVVNDLATVDRELALSIEAGLISGALLERPRRKWARQRLERYRGRLTGATPAERRLMVTLAHFDAFAGRDSADTLAYTAERVVAAGEILDPSKGSTTPSIYAIDLLVLADRLDPARAALDGALEGASRRGSNWWFASVCGWRCWLLARQGELLEAEADARNCAEVSLPEGWFAAAPPMLGFVLEVLIDRGLLDDAERILERAGIAESTLDKDFSFDPVVHARARLRAARGDLAGARSDLAKILGARARWNTFPSLVPALLIAPELASSDPSEKREGAERMLRDAKTWGTPRAIGMALRAAGLAAGGSRGVELLGEAATVLEGSPARLEHARALIDLGAALRRANHSAQARDPLRRGLDLAHACGAQPLAERARQELLAAGGRPRRPRISGAEALTPSERRIATMAAEGLSNPEIAQSLFITKKTVETHLGNAYRKLRIRSRNEIAAALDQDGH